MIPQMTERVQQKLADIDNSIPEGFICRVKTSEEPSNVLKYLEFQLETCEEEAVIITS